MGLDIVSVTLFPQTERKALGFKEQSQQVQVPTSSDGSRQMLVSSLITVLTRQFPKFAPHVNSCHVGRGPDTANSELLQRDGRLFPGDSISVHIVPPAPELPAPAGSARRQPTEYDRLSKPLVLTLCDYQAPGGSWPMPLPPTSVLLASSGFAHDHATAKLLLSGTKCFWVIPGVILAGPTPDNGHTVRRILETGVRAFVDLRAMGEGEEYEEMVRFHYAEMVAESARRPPPFLFSLARAPSRSAPQ